MGTAVLDLYLSHRCVRAEIPMLQFTRVKYLLDSYPSEFIRGALRAEPEPLAAEGEQPRVVTRNFAVRLRDVRLVHPIAESPSTPPSEAERRQRKVEGVTLELDDWTVKGDLYHTEQFHWLDFILNSSHEFLPLARASVDFGVGVPPVSFNFVLVNAAHISVVHEVLG